MLLRMWQFPEELSLKIVPLLSWRDIGQCRLVCQEWRRYLDSMVEEQNCWLTSPPVLHEIPFRLLNAQLKEREDGLYALHPIVNVGDDFFICERKANERFASAVHVVSKCDYEGSVKLMKQTIWLVPFDVLSVDQVFAAYFKPGSFSRYYRTAQKLEGVCFSTVEIFERRTLQPLPEHEALTNVVAMCRKGDLIYHLCLLKDENSTKCFKLFVLESLEWRELASTAITTDRRYDSTISERTSTCALNFGTCRPHLQVEDSLIIWTCGVHTKRLFLVDMSAYCPTVSMMELDGGSFSGWAPAPFSCPTVLFGGHILGVRVREREAQAWHFVRADLVDFSRNLTIEELPYAKNLIQICSERSLVYVMELMDSSSFLLLCIEKESYKTRRVSFPRCPHVLWNDVRMELNDAMNQLVIHIVSNEARTSLRSSNHIFVFDLTQEDLGLGMRVFNLGVYNYAPAISFARGLLIWDVGLVKIEEGNKQWLSEAIKMSSISKRGFAQISQNRDHKKVQDCGPEIKPVYLPTCLEEMMSVNDWERCYPSTLTLKCKWCKAEFAEHSYWSPLLPLRMEPAVFMYDELIQNKMYTPGGYSEEATEELHARCRAARGKCLGFFNDNTAVVGPMNDLYTPCRGDAQSCFHARWN